MDCQAQLQCSLFLLWLCLHRSLQASTDLPMGLYIKFLPNLHHQLPFEKSFPKRGFGKQLHPKGWILFWKIYLLTSEWEPACMYSICIYWNVCWMNLNINYVFASNILPYAYRLFHQVKISYCELDANPPNAYERKKNKFLSSSNRTGNHDNE